MDVPCSVIQPNAAPMHTHPKQNRLSIGFGLALWGSYVGLVYDWRVVLGSRKWESSEILEEPRHVWQVFELLLRNPKEPRARGAQMVPLKSPAAGT